MRCRSKAFVLGLAYFSVCSPKGRLSPIYLLYFNWYGSTIVGRYAYGWKARMTSAAAA